MLDRIMHAVIALCCLSTIIVVILGVAFICTFVRCWPPTPQSSVFDGMETAVHVLLTEMKSTAFHEIDSKFIGADPIGDSPPLEHDAIGLNQPPNGRSYLTVQKPACRPEGNYDPCAIRSEFGFDGSVPTTAAYPDEPPTYEEVFFNSYGVFDVEDVPSGYLSVAPHIAVRGAFIPGSTDCAGYPLLFPGWTYDDSESPYIEVPEDAVVSGEWNIHHWACFTSFSVSEYIVGRGPSEIKVHHANFAVPYDSVRYPSLEPYTDRLNSVKSDIASSYEGSEWVLWLGPSPSMSLVTWSAYSYWDVQRTDDGTIKVIAPHAHHYDYLDDSDDVLRPSLSSFRRDVKEAHRKRVSKTDGHIGVDASTPMLVEDVYDLPDYFDESEADQIPAITPSPPAVSAAAPAGLEAGPPANAGIALSWSAPALSRVTGYKIVRRVPKGEFATVVADTGSTDTTYTDTSAPMTAGATYIYRVLALNEYGESVASNRATVELPGPDAPADLIATYSDGDVVLTWTQPGVIQPSCYRIYRRAQREQSFTKVENCWRYDLRTWTDEDVTSGTRYIYRLVPIINTTESGVTESGNTARASIRVP